MMKNKEYKRFLKYLFSKYIAENLVHIPREHSWVRVNEKKHYRDTLLLLRCLNDLCETDEDFGMLVRAECLYEKTFIIRAAFREHYYIASRLGLFNMWEDHYAEIVAGLSVANFPKGELGLLKDFGVVRSQEELTETIYYVKKQAPKQHFERGEIRPLIWGVSGELMYYEDEAGDTRFDNEKDLMLNEECQENNKKKKPKPKPKLNRKWFKGLGKIGEGVTTSMLDILLATGMLNLPIPPEDKAWKVITSVTTGFGKIMDGVGDLRGE